MSRVYYHVTTEQLWNDKISKEGLKPMCGVNCLLNRGNKPLTYLCDAQNVNFWRILTGNNFVLEINPAYINEEKLRYHAYNGYTEFMYDEPVDTKGLKPANISGPKLFHKRSLVYAYTDMLCELVEKFANYYFGTNKSPEKYIEDRLNCLLRMESKLDFSVLDVAAKCDYIHHLARQGEYTFVDMFQNTGKHLYEMLDLYEHDNFTDRRKQLHDSILRDYSGCLSLDTGVWSAR